MSTPKQIVIIGNGMVGHRFIEEMVKSPDYTQFQLTTFCEESEVAYDRVGLSSYFAGKTRKDLSMVEDGFYDGNGVKIHIGDKAVKIDHEAKVVTSGAGQGSPLRHARARHGKLSICPTDRRP